MASISKIAGMEFGRVVGQYAKVTVVIVTIGVVCLEVWAHLPRLSVR